MGRFVGTLSGHVGTIYQLAWSLDSRMVISVSKDGMVKVLFFFLLVVPPVSALKA